MAKILIVEDDEKLRNELNIFLNSNWMLPYIFWNNKDNKSNKWF